MPLHTKIRFSENHSFLFFIFAMINSDFFKNLSLRRIAIYPRNRSKREFAKRLKFLEILGQFYKVSLWFWHAVIVKSGSSLVNFWSFDKISSVIVFGDKGGNFGRCCSLRTTFLHTENEEEKMGLSRRNGFHAIKCIPGERSAQAEFKYVNFRASRLNLPAHDVPKASRLTRHSRLSSCRDGGHDA